MLLALHGAPLVFANADTRGSAQQGPDAPPAKKVVEAQEKQIHDREVALGPPAPAKAGPATVGSSCPTVVIPGRVEAFNPGEAPFLGGRKFTTQVVVSRGGAGYVIYAGAADDDARQGIIVVHRLAGNLCADPGDSGTFSMFMDSTGLNGPLSLRSVAGATVTFTRASGRDGTFDVDAGAYMG